MPNKICILLPFGFIIVVIICDNWIDTKSDTEISHFGGEEERKNGEQVFNVDNCVKFSPHKMKK